MLRIDENKNPLFTQKHIEHLKKYKNNYGLNIGAEEFLKEEDNISKGQASKRCGENQRCFEIYDNDDYIGDITITNIKENNDELDLVIFDEYENKGYAKEAIKEFIEIYFNGIGKILDVIIREDNTNKNKIKHILEYNKFSFKDHNIYGDLIFSISNI